MSKVFLGDSVIRKKSIAVFIELANGQRIECNVFLGANQRLQDLLNGDRSFLPVVYSENDQAFYKLINKSYIISFEEID